MGRKPIVFPAGLTRDKMSSVSVPLLNEKRMAEVYECGAEGCGYQHTNLKAVSEKISHSNESIPIHAT